VVFELCKNDLSRTPLGTPFPKPHTTWHLDSAAFGARHSASFSQYFSLDPRMLSSVVYRTSNVNDMHILNVVFIDLLVYAAAVSSDVSISRLRTTKLPWLSIVAKDCAGHLSMPAGCPPGLDEKHCHLSLRIIVFIRPTDVEL